MKIALVNPNTSAETTAMMVRIAVQEAGSAATIDGHTAPFGVPLITDPTALAEAAGAVVALAPALAAADAVIVAAFGDPGIDRLRLMLAQTVTGIAEAAMHEAAAKGRTFAVVTTTPALRDTIAETAARYGHTGFAGTWVTGGDPRRLTADAPSLQAALADAIDAALRVGRAEAIVIGGGPLAEAARALSGDCPVPLIEPVPAAVRLSLARRATGAQS